MSVRFRQAAPQECRETGGQVHRVYGQGGGGCGGMKIDANMFDKETIIEGCTVQILVNSVTGEVSIGWWIGGAEDRPGYAEKL